LAGSHHSSEVIFADFKSERLRIKRIRTGMMKNNRTNPPAGARNP
jgi:hypothetical protein